MNNKKTSYIVFVFTLVATAGNLNSMDFNYQAEMNRHRAELERQRAELQRLTQGLSSLGLGQGFANPYQTGPQAAQSSNESHTKIIPLSEDLKQKPMLHWGCDCTSLQGHYCGSHALSHAVYINKTIGLIKSELKAAEIVKNTIEKLDIQLNKSSLTNSANLIRVANDLKLTNIFLCFEGHDVLNFLGDGPADSLARLRKTYEYLNTMRDNFFRDLSKKKAHHFFVTFDVHVVLISVICDGEDVSIEIHDNLNKAIEPGSTLHKYIKIISDYYLAGAEQQMKLLISRTLSAKALSNSFVESTLFKKDEIARVAQTPKQLNLLLKKTKKLGKLRKSPVIRQSIINIYSCFIDFAEKFPGLSTENRIILSDNIIQSIKNSHKERFFDIQQENDAAELFERAQSVRRLLQ